MFKFLKEKLSKAVSAFSKKVEEDKDAKVEEKVVESPLEEIAEKKKEVIEAVQSEAQSILDEAEDDADSEVELEERAVEEARLAAIKAQEDLEAKRLEIEAKIALEKKRQEEAAALEIERAKKELEKARVEQERKDLLARREAKRKEEQKRLEEEQKKLAEKKKQGFLKKLFGKKEEPKKVESPRLILEKEEYDDVFEDHSDELEEVVEELRPVEKPVETKAVPQPKPEVVEEKKSFFEKIKETVTTVKLSDEKFNELFWDLEFTMLENNVAVEVIEKIKEDLRVELTTGKVQRKTIDQIVHDTLKKSVEDLFNSAESFDLIDKIRMSGKKPYVIAFIGVNGSGKTTTMAKIANYLLKNDLSVVFAASDTFRAAAMAQLQEHADRLGVKMIKHDYESDPAAVAFDAIKHAQAKDIDVVLIDTAGRLHTNDNLMNELKKLIRVNKPDLKIFIGESITGNDCVEQAKLFNEAVGIDAIVLAKADVDEKGGAALSVSHVTKKPILFLGTGQTYDDLQEFDSEVIVKNIGL
jgi:fused signal recognition particle receptor